MKIKYSRDADVLIIKLREGKPSDSRDIAEGIIVHLTAAYSAQFGQAFRSIPAGYSGRCGRGRSEARLEVFLLA